MPRALPSFDRTRCLLVCLELVLVAAVFAGSYSVAFRYASTVQAPALLEWELKPAVMVGCGYGFTQPATVSPAAASFVGRQRDAISCEEFATTGAPIPAIGIAHANRYSIYGAGWAIRVGGVSWRTIDIYLAVLFGVAMVFVYGLFRQGVGRLLAVCGVIALVYSPVLLEITSLRDFIKLPCFTGLWLVLAWLIRRGLTNGVRATHVPMAVGGALLGLGIGLRMDALVLSPLFVVTLFLGLPGFGRRELVMKGAATLLFLAMFLVAGSPILRSLSSGSNFAHFVVLGAMTPFDAALSVEPAPYDIGSHYADGFAYTVIVSHGLQSQGERLPIFLGSAEYDRVGGRLLSTLAQQFPADIVTRGLGATLQVFRAPFDSGVREYAERLPTVQDSPVAQTIGKWRSSVLGAFEGRVLAAAVVVLALASAVSWRLGAIGLLLALYLCGYSMLQFQRRHTFHLEVLPVFMALLALYLPTVLITRAFLAFRRGRDEGVLLVRRHAREMGMGLVVVTVLVLATAGTLRAAQAWQQQSVARLVDRTLRADWVPVPATEESLADLILENGNPVASWYEIFRRDPELWRDGLLLRTPGVVPRGEEANSLGDLRQQYFRLILEPRCGGPEVLVALNYSGAVATSDSEYTRAFRVAVTPEGHSELLVPAYYHLGSTWNRLDGFAVPVTHRGCVTRIFRARDPSALPLPVAAFVLSPGWRERPLHQRLLARPTITIAGTPVDQEPDLEHNRTPRMTDLFRWNLLS